MILKIKGHTVNYFNSFSLTLAFNTIASGFSFTFAFDETNELHKKLFRPGQYLPCTLEHNGELLLTGTILSQSFKDSSQPELMTISGYSLPGKLEDCKIPTSLYPLESNGLSLKQIATKLIKPFGIVLIVENQNSNNPYFKQVKSKTDAQEVSDAMDDKIEKSTAYETQSIKDYLTEIAAQKNVIMSHNEKGQLVFTRSKTDLKPILDFNGVAPGTDIDLVFDAQAMHSHITVQKQADSSGGNAGEVTITNPYCELYRTDVITQSSGTDINTSQAARNALSSELAKIKLTIKTDRWEVNGKILKPNNIISVTSPKCCIYKKSNFFIESINFEGDNEKTIATLNCVLPEVYNNQTPKNIFK